jgi:hypothetical protein
MRLAKILGPPLYAILRTAAPSGMRRAVVFPGTK